MGNANSIFCSASDTPLDNGKANFQQLFNVGSEVLVGCSPLGQSKNLAGSCDSTHGYTYNGANQGSCSYCGTNANGAVLSSGAGVVGEKSRCALTSFTGSKDKCCIGGFDYDENGICDPKYSPINYGNGECDDAMTNYCKSNINTANCQTFLSSRNNTSGVNNMMQEYCSQGDFIKSDANCKAYAQKNPGVFAFL